jgi:hypothetical protein
MIVSVLPMMALEKEEPATTTGQDAQGCAAALADLD